MNKPLRYSRTEWRRRAAIIAFAVFAFVSYIVLISLSLYHARERELETVLTQQTSLVKVLESQADATLKKIDTVLLSVQQKLTGTPANLRPAPSVMNQILASHLALIGESQSLRVADAQGRFIYDASGVLHSATISDRKYFLRNRADPNGELIISEPLFARITHNWVVTVSRRINDDKGGFAGLIQAAVRAEFFENFYESLNLGKSYSVTLVDGKSRMLARFPAKEDQLGKPIKSPLLRDFMASGANDTQYTTISAVDNVERSYMVRKVGPYPLYLIIGHTKSDQLSAWHQQLVWSIVGIVVLGGVLLGWIIVWLRSYDSALALAGRMTSAYEVTLQRMRHLAGHDPLTDLPNRALLEERMATALADTKGRRADLVLMFIDLDHFKDINDTLGHAVGDKLLVQVAERLRQGLTDQDTISRQGGDEFAVLLRGYANLTQVAETAQRLIEQLDPPFEVNEHELRVTASIGISVYPQDGPDIVTLLKNADTAMYQAKAEGGRAFHFFTEEMNARVLNRVTLDKNLHSALEYQEFVLLYQPQVDGASGQITGVEALIRWHHPQQGDISPAQFIPAAEESGIINGIGDWVLNQACFQTRRWLDLGLPELTMAVNISAVQLRQPDFVDKVMATLCQYGLPAEYLELEITESALIRDTQRIVRILNELRKQGVRLSVDDFGTGYSSLAYLKNLPFDKIKIDQSFIRGIPEREDDAAITEVIIGIAKSLKMELIAEGVETKEQSAFLLQHHCQQMQGFFFGKPMPAAEIEQRLRQSVEACPVQ
ncbi:EAL domain-containing protein [Amphritea pacifica]|uniref:bifunctional diguanylate cyclase/phosphodiesterase n=1 Tax=Amphritea pacifica TaxID=2811233 RepID=UPI001963A0E3|nr:EAL domain-containing protein [Amphritea pacifica]